MIIPLVLEVYFIQFVPYSWDVYIHFYTTFSCLLLLEQKVPRTLVSSTQWSVVFAVCGA